MARVVVAEHAGVCFGVSRALELAEQSAREAAGPVRTLGPLIHNPTVVRGLAEQGVAVVDRPEDAPAGGTLVMRAHGVAPQVEERARSAGLVLVDATCPYVKRVHRAAAQLADEGYQVVVVGETGHAEVEGICGHAPDALVMGSAADLEGASVARRVGVVVQTTTEQAVLRAVVDALVGRCDELRLVDTICSATSERQQAAAALADKADVMLVLGGRNSANTRHLADVCRARCAATYHVESPDELDAAWLAGASLVGITAGASTPADQIEALRQQVEQLVSTPLPGGALPKGTVPSGSAGKPTLP